MLLFFIRYMLYYIKHGMSYLAGAPFLPGTLPLTYGEGGSVGAGDATPLGTGILQRREHTHAPRQGPLD
jgi:hypothetical protein